MPADEGPRHLRPARLRLKRADANRHEPREPTSRAAARSRPTSTAPPPQAWARLTSTRRSSGIRATRARRPRPHARDAARLAAAPTCGARACSTRAAAPARSPSRRRGAAPTVVAIDLSPTLVRLARERLPADVARRRSTSVPATCSTTALGRFDHVVLHGLADPLSRRRRSSPRSRASPTARPASIAFTFAPSNPLLASMITVGRLFPRRDRAPFIEPVAEREAAPSPRDVAGARRVAGRAAPSASRAASTRRRRCSCGVRRASREALGPGRVATLDPARARRSCRSPMPRARRCR